MNFVVGSIPSLFGSDAGAKLQRWCRIMRRPLVWSLAGAGSGAAGGAGGERMPKSWRANTRFLDPTVRVFDEYTPYRCVVELALW